MLLEIEGIEDSAMPILRISDGGADVPEKRARKMWQALRKRNAKFNEEMDFR